MRLKCFFRPTLYAGLFDKPVPVNQPGPYPRAYIDQRPAAYDPRFALHCGRSRVGLVHENGISEKRAAAINGINAIRDVLSEINLRGKLAAFRRTYPRFRCAVN